MDNGEHIVCSALVHGGKLFPVFFLILLRSLFHLQSRNAKCQMNRMMHICLQVHGSLLLITLRYEATDGAKSFK